MSVINLLFTVTLTIPSAAWFRYRPSRLPRDGAAAKASDIVAPWRSGWLGDRGRSTNTVASSSVFEGQPWKRAHACATSRPRADEP